MARRDELVDLALGILNGAVGQYLARANNGLAIEMSLVAGGRAIDAEAVATALPRSRSRVVVLVHGLMVTERSWAFPDGTDYGSLLEHDVGTTTLRVRYNTGRAIPENGRSLSELLERVVASHPSAIGELILVGHSMGGLVIRSACHVASTGASSWLPLVRRAIYVGTPHFGAPLERAGLLATRVLGAIDDPYTRLVADIAHLRSDGIKDLGLGLSDARHPVPLLPGIAHCLIAGSVSTREPWATLFGDGMVSRGSATHGGRDGHSVRLVPGVGHASLAHNLGVYAHLRAFVEA